MNKQENKYINIAIQALTSDKKKFGKILAEENTSRPVVTYKPPLYDMFLKQFPDTTNKESLLALSLIGVLFLSVIHCNFPKEIFRSTVLFLKENISIPTFNCNHYEQLYRHLSNESHVKLQLFKDINIFITAELTKEDILETFDFLTNGI